MSTHQDDSPGPDTVNAAHGHDNAYQRQAVHASARRPGPLCVGVGGPVGAGKTALIYRLCQALAPTLRMGVVTNDIYTREDAAFLARHSALPPALVIGVETGGCPHAAIRDDVSGNLEAIDELLRGAPDLQLVLVESGGDNLAATFSPDLVDRDIYVIDVAAGDKIPRKRGRGMTRADLLIVNKIDLAPYVGADLAVMARDAHAVRAERPTLFTNLQDGAGMPDVLAVINGWLPVPVSQPACAAVPLEAGRLPRWSSGHS